MGIVLLSILFDPRGGGKSLRRWEEHPTVLGRSEIYEPEIVRNFYTAKINKAFAIPFDMDIFNVYNYYDRDERVYWGMEEAENDKEKENAVRNYELSQIGEVKKRAQPLFGFCVDIVQITDDLDRAIEVLQKTGHVPEKLSNDDKERIALRLKLSKNWVEKYAPSNVKLNVLEKMPDVELSNEQREVLHRIADVLDEKELETKIVGIAKEIDLPTKKAFEAAYLVLLGKKSGPRLAPFLQTLDKKFVKQRFSET